MQTARLLEPKSRNYSNKLIEIFRALQLEFHFSKDEILEIYLNKIPFGGNVEGVSAASVLFFNKNPDQLSLAQSVALSIIPNNPNLFNLNGDNKLINQQKNLQLKRLSNSSLFDKELLHDAFTEFVNPKRHNSPKTAPHFSQRVINENPDSFVINTTINFTLQKMAEEITYNYMLNWQNYGINNAAVLILNNLTSEITTYIGSNDFNDISSSGQVDGVISIRSPGSTLKPFLYALAVDNGMITPKFSLLDVPILDMDYTPGNFDGKYRGRISAENALAQSLNIPAVNLLNDYGYKNFINKLINLNFKSISDNKNNLGLSMILGGCGVNLENLTNLYSIFPQNGYYTKSNYLKNSKKLSFSVLSKESAYIISDILLKLERPDLPNNYQSARGVPVIAWKTGTSQGRRDGWAIGFNGVYTVGVWTGNFSGKSNSLISGANVSVPLLFDIFHSISGEEKRAWMKLPEGLDTRLVDATTGLLPSEYSRHTVTDYYIPGVSKSKITDHLKSVSISNDEKLSYCIECKDENNCKSKIYEVYPIELLNYYNSFNISYDKIPPHNPKCNAKIGNEPPLIISPKQNSEYFIELNSGDGISLSAKSSSGIDKIYWFINNKFFKKCNSGEVIIWIPEESNKYKITCIDANGNSSELNTTVKIY
jgi:penicillin-binding protein 1C